MAFIINYHHLDLSAKKQVGSKNAALGEMQSKLKSLGIRSAPGFALTMDAYHAFLTHNQLDKVINEHLKRLRPDNIKQLNTTSKTIRQLILKGTFPKALLKEILQHYHALKATSVAIRSSASVEDLYDASFAGAQETFLNIKGEKNVLNAVKMVYASLFNARAISYRQHKKIDQTTMAISVGVQRMVRSDKGASGVLFTLDTESGFDQVIVMSASYGLGEAIVQGKVNPDEYIVYKPNIAAGKPAILQRSLGTKVAKMIYTDSSQPKYSIKLLPTSKQEQQRFCLSDKEIEQLSKMAIVLEKHFKTPLDIEWAKDGLDKQIYIVQARPETVASRKRLQKVIKRYHLKKKGPCLTEGQSIGQHIGVGKARIIHQLKDMSKFKKGEVLVTDMTDPDWEPIMKQAAAIVTNRGGRTCHAAIIARELGIPAVVGTTNATKVIKQQALVTVSCAEGQQGKVYAGKLPFVIEEINVSELPPIPVKLCINMGNPERAFISRQLPNRGVGLARLEFIISDMVGIHPNAILQINEVPSAIRKEIAAKTAAYANPKEYYIERLREGISMIAAAFAPQDVIFRFSDFKSNEYENLLGGKQFEPNEENPMLGFRGASRYSHPRFKDCFALECAAFKRVREENGLKNTQVMIPFVRTVEELKSVLAIMKKNGLKRSKDFKVYMMCEIPSNVLLAEEFLRHVDGFSIGSNDLTQLTLGLDRDSSLIADLFDERDPAMKRLLKEVIATCKAQQKYIGICGQGPSDHTDFAEWLMDEGIEAMSLSVDTILATWMHLAEITRE